MGLRGAFLLVVGVLTAGPVLAAERGAGALILAQFGGRDLVCRVSPEASRYTGGDRDCRARQVGPDGSCSCPSAYGPVPGVVVGQYGGRSRGYAPRVVTVCRVSPQGSRYTGGDRDCPPDYSDGRTCACPSPAGMIPGRLLRVPEY